MARKRVISKEAMRSIKQEIHDRGEMAKSEVADLVRPHCSFDPIALQEREVNRIVGRIIRSIRDVNGTRTAFLIQGHDTIVNIETCNSYPKVAAIDDQLVKQLDGLTRSRKKSLRRKLELSGQMSLFAAKG